jgi:hypothetical protein
MLTVHLKKLPFRLGYPQGPEFSSRFRGRLRQLSVLRQATRALGFPHALQHMPKLSPHLRVPYLSRSQIHLFPAVDTLMTCSGASPLA